MGGPGGNDVTALPTPFPGLRAFQEEDARFYFGQERHIDALFEKLGDARFLTVIGASGSGKSSLVRAGLIPELRAAGSAERPRWKILTCKPGDNPLANLAKAVEKELGGGLLAENRLPLDARLRQSARALADIVGDAGLEAEQRVLVVVDQFEQLFRYRRDSQQPNREDEAALFVRLLLEASADTKAGVYVVITM